MFLDEKEDLELQVDSLKQEVNRLGFQKEDQLSHMLQLDTSNRINENLETEKNFLLEKAGKELKMQKLQSQIEILKLESNLASVQLDLEKERGGGQDTLEYTVSNKEEIDKKSNALDEESEKSECNFCKYNLDWKSMLENDEDRNKFKEYFTHDYLHKNLPPTSTILSEIKEKWSSNQELIDRNRDFTDKNISEQQIGINNKNDKKTDTIKNENQASLANIKNEQLELELLKIQFYKELELLKGTKTDQVKVEESQDKKFNKYPKGPYLKSKFRTSTEEAIVLSGREIRDHVSPMKLSRHGYEDSEINLHVNMEFDDFYIARGAEYNSLMEHRSWVDSTKQKKAFVLEENVKNKTPIEGIAESVECIEYSHENIITELPEINSVDENTLQVYKKMINDLTAKFHMLSESYANKVMELDTCKKELECTTKNLIEKDNIEYDSVKQRSNQQYQSRNYTRETSVFKIWANNKQNTDRDHKRDSKSVVPNNYEKSRYNPRININQGKYIPTFLL